MRVFGGGFVLKEYDIKLTETELIKLTVKYGHDGSELKNRYFMKNGYLEKGNNSHNSFIKKVESICESHQRLKKKRGEHEVYYLINGLYDSMDDYTGGKGGYKYNNILPLKDYILQKITFVSYALDFEDDDIATWSPTPKMNHTYGTWAYKLGLPYEYDEEKLEIVEEFLCRFFTPLQVELILKEYKNHRVLRSRSLVQQVFKQLQKENKIEVTEKYFGKTRDNYNKSIAKEKYDELYSQLDSTLKEANINKTVWNLQKNNPKVKMAQDNFENENEGNFISIGKSYKVKLLYDLYDENREFDFNGEWESFINAYYDNLISLANKHKGFKTDNPTPFQYFYKTLIPMLSDLFKENCEYLSVEEVLDKYKSDIESFIVYKHDAQMKAILKNHIEIDDETIKLKGGKEFVELEDLKPDNKHQAFSMFYYFNGEEHYLDSKKNIPYYPPTVKNQPVNYWAA